ncbi:hypothetical protein KOR34_11040 [Posidoniimonas corsicana]|uniref:Uncharacterized protein n=1 Tax=Posidoniimonas corsicana TaxID=1938618 RepID=A0A5C5VDX5_9BACT|nr:hypothetical protein [Posidoniimonas corsicana]TWT36203.1 hypothetical protein KOR34_11040 [Posidoniimonas corsicana]
MDFFTGLALIMAAAFIAASFFRDRISDPRRHRLSLNAFLLFLVCYFGMPALPQVGPFIALATRPIGVVCLFLSLRVLCSVPTLAVDRATTSAAA